MLVIYVLLVLQSVLAHHHDHRKEKIYYNEADSHFHFEKFIEKHNRTYSDDAEREARFAIFYENLIKLNELNDRDPHCTFGINQFTDLSKEEFLGQYTGLNMALNDGSDGCKTIYGSESGSGWIPEVFDWRDYIHIPIKNQKNCGACWAFSATGNVEAQVAIKHDTIISLSEQQILDCDRNDYACSGGIPSSAFRYLIQSGGQELENSYPYINGQGPCQFSPGKARVRVVDCVNIQFESEEAIKVKLFNLGPLTAGLSGYDILNYNGGVMTNCGHGRIDHAVLIIGYGRDDVVDKDFWLIKNSWGTGWGENGFARIERRVNSCGIMNGTFSTSLIM